MIIVLRNDSQHALAPTRHGAWLLVQPGNYARHRLIAARQNDFLARRQFVEDLGQMILGFFQGDRLHDSAPARRDARMATTALSTLLACSWTVKSAAVCATARSTCAAAVPARCVRRGEGRRK